MKRTLLVLSTFLSAMTFAQNCSELFISEYVEGVGTNKALEIYNPTASPIDLSAYFVTRISNGASVSSASAATSVQLTGTIPAYGTHVGVLDKRDPSGTGQETPVWDELQDKADAFYCPVYATSNAWYWNGNDCIMLAKGSASSPQAPGTILVDFFGKDGQDPENTVMGTNGWSSVAPYDMTAAQGGNTMDRVVTEDHSMIRKPNVMIGKNNLGEVLGASYVFNPLLQYDSIPALIPRLDEVTGDTLYQVDGVTPQWTGNWESLGWHDCDCNPLSVDEVKAEKVTIYPNPSTGEFFIKGLANVQTVSVINALGQEVLNVNNNTQTIIAVDLTNRRGVYFVKLTDKSGTTITKRIIVK